MRAILISSILIMLSASCKNGLNTLQAAEKAKRAVSTCASAMQSACGEDKVSDKDKDDTKKTETAAYPINSWDNKMLLW